MNFHAIDLGLFVTSSYTIWLFELILYSCWNLFVIYFAELVKVYFFSIWVMRHWVVCLAGSDAKSHHRRALANLQSTIVEHEEQLKDMERRTVTVTTVISYVFRTCSINWDLHLVCICTDWEIFLLLFTFLICHLVDCLTHCGSIFPVVSHHKWWLGPNPDNNHCLFTGAWRDEIVLGRCETMMMETRISVRLLLLLLLLHHSVVLMLVSRHHWVWGDGISVHDASLLIRLATTPSKLLPIF